MLTSTWSLLSPSTIPTYTRYRTLLHFSVTTHLKYATMYAKAAGSTVRSLKETHQKPFYESPPTIQS